MALEALEHHRAGRLAEAEQIYRQILSLDPGIQIVFICSA